MIPFQPAHTVRHAAGLALLLGTLMGSPAIAADATRVAPDDPALIQVLEQAGWTVERRPGGDLFIRPAGREAGASMPSEAGVDGGDALDVVVDRLRELGWAMTRDAQGNVFLRPVEPAGAPDRSVAKEGAPAPAGTAAEAGESPLDSLERRLKAAGWAVQRDTEDALRVSRPPPASADTSASRQPVALPLSPAVMQRLERAGWGVERDDDGSVRLIPAGPRASAALETWRALGDVGPERSVETWQDAHEVARAWLASTGDPSLAVGKIRRLLRIHVVSIVTAEPPFLLKNQLIIRSRDGRVIAVE